MPFFYYYDPTYILVLIGAVLSLWASATVKSTYNKYSRVYSYSGLTGAQAAAQILRQAGIYDVRIEHVSGNLTDHYDPKARVLRLSDSVYGSNSVAAIGVAAHECGHAIQHARGYAPLTIRGAIVPVVNFASNASWILIMLGLFMTSTTSLLKIGILLFATTVVFQLITLPVEFNASHRALIQIENLGIVTRDERRESKKVLDAAALTYVAAAASAILQLLRLITIANRRDD